MEFLLLKFLEEAILNFFIRNLSFFSNKFMLSSLVQAELLALKILLFVQAMILLPHLMLNQQFIHLNQKLTNNNNNSKYNNKKVRRKKNKKKNKINFWKKKEKNIKNLLSMEIFQVMMKSDSVFFLIFIYD